MTRYTAAGAIVAAAALLLSGCAGGSAAQSTDPKSVSGEITVWTWDPSAEASTELFTKDYPDVKVNFVHKGDGNTLYQQIQTAFEAGSGAPDVTMVEFDMLPQWALSGDLVALNDYGVDKIADDFTDASIGVSTIDGKIYGIPSDVGPMAFAYRKDLLDAAGITPPTTWDEFEAAAAAFQAKYPGSYLVNSPFADTNTQQMLWQAGVKPVKIDGDSISLDYDSPEAVKVVSFWNDLVKKGLVGTYPVFSPDWNAAVASDKLGAMLAAAWSEQLTSPAVEDTSFGKWALAPLPTWDGTASSAMWGGSSYAVTSQSKNKAAAAAYAMFMGHDPRISKVPNAGFPVLKKTTEDTDFMDQPNEFYGGAPARSIFAEAMTTVPEGWEWTPFSSTIMTAFNDNMADMQEGKLTPDEAMAAVQKTAVDFATEQGFTVEK